MEARKIYRNGGEERKAESLCLAAFSSAITAEKENHRGEKKATSFDAKRKKKAEK